MTTLTSSKHFRILSAMALGLVSLMGLTLYSPAVSGSGAVDALTDEELARALARNEGGIIKIGPGAHAPIMIRNFAGQRPLVIESANPDDPARLAGLTITGSRNVTVRNVVIQPPQLSAVAAATKGADAQSSANVKGSSDIIINGVTLIGAPVDGDIGNGTGMLIRNGRNIQIISCQFSHFRYGLSFLSGEGFRIERNEFHDLRTDAIRGGGVSKLLIEGNVISNLKPDAGDHPDGVQLWTVNETEPARDIVIRGNFIYRGSGGIIQGIFLRDNKLQLPFEDLEISDNLVVGSMYNGISVQGGKRLKIVGNEVIPVGDQKSWIRLNSGDQAIMAENRAAIYILKDNGKVEERRNKIARPSNKETSVRVGIWLQNHPELTKGAGPLLLSIMREVGLSAGHQ